MRGWSRKRDGSATAPFTAQLPWAVVLVGVGVMIGLFVVSVLTLTTPDRPTTARASGRASEPPARPSLADLGPVPAAPSGTQPPFAPATSSAAPLPGDAGAPVPGNGRTSVPGIVGPPPPTTAGRPPDVTGRYTIFSASGQSFIGEVLITNTSTREQGWTVQLRFAADVGNLDAFWIEGAQQPTLRRSDASFIFASQATVPAGSSVRLRFDFDRTGPRNTPTTCLVNGAGCAIG